MKLAKLIEVDSPIENKISLKDAFGDSYLCEKNRIYYKMRAEALAYGFKYSKEYNQSYNALPLSQLETLLKNKTIPFFNNRSVLVEIEKNIPSQVVWDEISDNLKRNSIFHESCHAVSRTNFNKIFNEKLNKNQKILQFLIEESFSNTCELLGIIDVEDTAHKIFYELNSYIFIIEIKSLISQLVHDCGFDKVFKMTLMSYLHSNFLHDHLDEKTQKKILNYLGYEELVTDKKFKKLKSLLRVAYELNPRFKFMTTQFYFKYLGCSISSEELLKVDFIPMLQADCRYLQFINQLEKIIIL